MDVIEAPDRETRSVIRVRSLKEERGYRHGLDMIMTVSNEDNNN